MSWAEEDLVPISALQHYVYCPRQCALIHMEQVWDENIFTMRGRRAHENVDRPDDFTKEGVRVEQAVPLWSERLGLIGRADVVEFLPDGTPYPVEHKVGPRKVRRADEVQLCAQAICLEEMLGRAVERGALYHHGSRRRREVSFSPELRATVGTVSQKVRELLKGETLPAPVADARCQNCSLSEACLPFVLKELPAWLEDE